MSALVVVMAALGGFLVGFLATVVLTRPRARATSIASYAPTEVLDHALAEQIRAHARDAGRPMLGDVVANAVLRRNQALRRIARDSGSRRKQRSR